MAMCRRLVLGLVIFMLGEQPSWLNPTQGNWTVNSQRVAGNCKNVLLPFGPAAGDTTYPAGFDVGGNINPSFGPIALPSGVRLLNSGPYNNPYINAQGVISFEAPQASLVTNLPVVGTSTAMIMVNPMDLASSSIADGNIFYRVVEASDAVAMADVLEATAIAWDTYPVYPALEWAFIVTWSCVRRNGGADSERQTFQFVLTTDGVTVATFHNFAEVNTPDDMLVGLQAGGAFAGDALSPSFFLNQYNACPCGRWALQVHDVFTMPMSGIKACPGDCSYDEPEGCVDCMAASRECVCTLGVSDDLSAMWIDGFQEKRYISPSDKQGWKELRTTAIVRTADDADPCKFMVDASFRRSKRGEVYIGFAQVHFGLHRRRSDRYDRRIRIRSGRQVTMHLWPNQMALTLPYAYADGLVFLDEADDGRTFRVSSPSCGWTVSFTSGDLPRAQRSLSVTSPAPMTADSTCGTC